MVAEPRRMSLAEFMALPDDGNRHEFVRGEVRVMPPPKGRHGRIEAALLAAIEMLYSTPVAMEERDSSMVDVVRAWAM